LRRRKEEEVGEEKEWIGLRDRRFVVEERL